MDTERERGGETETERGRDIEKREREQGGVVWIVPARLNQDPSGKIKSAKLIFIGSKTGAFVFLDFFLVFFFFFYALDVTGIPVIFVRDNEAKNSRGNKWHSCERRGIKRMQ